MEKKNVLAVKIVLVDAKKDKSVHAMVNAKKNQNAIVMMKIVNAKNSKIIW